MRFFFDNNLSPKLARSLHAFVEPRHQVVHLKDRFAANTPDEVWMRALAGEPDWVIISGDLQIRKNPHEIRAWQQAGHTTFFLKKGWIALTFWDQANSAVGHREHGGKCRGHRVLLRIFDASVLHLGGERRIVRCMNGKKRSVNSFPISVASVTGSTAAFRIRRGSSRKFFRS